MPCIFSVHAGLARNGCAGLDIRLCSSVAQTGKETTVALKTDGVGFVLSHPIPTTSSFSSFSAVHAKSRVSDSLTPTCRSFWRTFRQNDTDHLTRHVAAENGGSFRRVWRGQGEWNYACLSALSRCPELTSRLMLQGNLGRRRYGAGARALAPPSPLPPPLFPFLHFPAPPLSLSPSFFHRREVLRSLT